MISQRKLANQVLQKQFRVEGSDREREEFLKRSMKWLDEQDYVERYSWFSALPNEAASLVNGGGGLSTLGGVYAYTPFA